MTAPNSQPTPIVLACSACGAKLNVSRDTHTCACTNCGAEFSVVHDGASVSLERVTDSLNDILIQNKRVAAELAIAQLKDEIAAEGTKNQQLVIQLEQDLAAVGEDPGSKVYLAAFGLGIAGIFFFVTGNFLHPNFGVFLILAGIGVFSYGVWRANQLSTTRNALLERCQQQVYAVQTAIDDSRAQIDTLRQNLA